MTKANEIPKHFSSDSILVSMSKSVFIRDDYSVSELSHDLMEVKTVWTDLKPSVLDMKQQDFLVIENPKLLFVLVSGDRDGGDQVVDVYDSKEKKVTEALLLNVF